MRRVVVTAVAVIVLVAAAFAAFIYSGIYDFAADRAHSPITTWIFNQARTRSVRAQAAEIGVPSRLDEQTKIAAGAGLFAQNCVACHGGPGVKRAEFAKGLYPRPPSLTTMAQVYSPAELFWITKHGISLSGMPALLDHSDDEIWATVALLERLPGMKPQDYAALVAASRAQQSPQTEAEPGVGSQQPAEPPRAEPRSSHRRRH
jgi:mono/diheme cytochrome c family protein